MAAFVAKQMIGGQLSSAKGAMPGGGDSESKEKTEEELQAERELEEARREAEEARIRKHQEFEAEREDMRQGVRDKYGIKTKEEKEATEKAQREQEAAGRVGRQKKTPEEIAAEMNDDGDEAFDPMKMVQGLIDTVKSKLPF